MVPVQLGRTQQHTLLGEPALGRLMGQANTKHPNKGELAAHQVHPATESHQHVAITTNSS